MIVLTKNLMSFFWKSVISLRGEPMINTERRKRVMQRSIKLGHCVCDPRQPCPCDLFKEKDVCMCAGERVPLEVGGKQVRLTEYVRSAGCASKIGQRDLHKVLKMLPLWLKCITPPSGRVGPLSCIGKLWRLRAMRPNGSWSSKLRTAPSRLSPSSGAII